MLRSVLAGDVWVRATFALVLVHAAFIVIVQARPGVIAVVLWYVAPVLVALAAAILLAVRFVRSWRRREGPTGRHLAEYAALTLVVGSLAALRTYPSSHDDKPSDIRFRLPLDGPVTVAWGGPTLAVNYHGIMPDQRWAFDLLVTRNGRTFRNDGSRLEDYYAYGRPVLAPAGGITRVVHDYEPDEPVGQWRFLRAAGNYIVLEMAPDEFLFVVHLQPGSITVAPGDLVSTGQVVGRVGNSGNSSEPHVHLHLQDSPRPYWGEGIPFYFHSYRFRGLEVMRGMPLGGRERPSRVSPGKFTGDVVEHIGRLEAATGSGPVHPKNAEVYSILTNGRNTGEVAVVTGTNARPETSTGFRRRQEEQRNAAGGRISCRMNSCI